MGFGLYFGDIPAVFQEDAPVCTVGLPMFLTLTSAVATLAEHATFAEMEHATFAEMELSSALRQELRSLRDDMTDVQRKLTERDAQWDLYQYGDWVCALFDLAGASAVIEELRTDRRYAEPPQHWNCGKHKLLEMGLDTLHISKEMFDVLWDLKQNRNFWTHRKSGFITIANYQMRFLNDHSELESRLFDLDQKNALKAAMQAVKLDFESRGYGGGGVGMAVGHEGGNRGTTGG